jgi:16S rRNA processing protein RimM
MPKVKVLLGRIAGAHGIRGEVLIKTHTERPESIAAYGPLSDESGARSFLISRARATAKGVIARIDGVGDRNAAEALKGMELFVDRERLPAPADDEFYFADLVGLAAVSPDGAPIGTIVSVQNYGAGDLLEIKLDGQRSTELVPFADAFVPSVDLAAGRVVVRMPQGSEDTDEAAAD